MIYSATYFFNETCNNLISTFKAAPFYQTQLNVPKYSEVRGECSASP